ncbi:dimethylaniline monooxygenase [N-oxide-forming] 3-like [Asterias rubens]|uniref:dimethylaniline monooxygenase [N-oxide-forming] 3-like n=1 Tax=Asterias rubens TaxID=7604 RepID=UPI001454EB46|nr:dimethylaniline monooxygenase [N-oxide-forming] 3-like [Asterias rubens]
MKAAIIGGGFSGLLSIKACIEEGIEPHCFERYDQLGGVWVYQEGLRPGQGSAIYDSLITNSSKVMMALSDYPFPKNAPPYPRPKHILKYMQDYAAHFDLEKYIQYNTSVLRVEPTADFETTGQWLVRTRMDGCEEKAVVFDAVFVCSGMYKKPFVPEYPGLDEFEGQKIHTNEFRKPDSFAGKTVVVMGSSNSAGDVAVDLSRWARQVHLTMRHGCWVVKRMSSDGVPVDMTVNKRIIQFAPTALVGKIAESKANVNFNHSKLGLSAEAGLLNSEVMINDEIGDRIMCGAIQCRPGVKRFTKNGVEFVDGVKVDNVDAVMFATGYELGYDFIDRSIIQDNFADLDLYLHVFPPKLRHQTLAVIGCVTTLGGQPPVFELQTRLAAQVFKGKVRMPDEQTMMDDVIRRRDVLFQTFGKHRLFFPPIPYQDHLADLMGAKPKFTKLFLTNPRLAFQVLFGPCYPATYRLCGPHSWSGAKKAVEESWDSIIHATQTRVPVKQRKQKSAVTSGGQFFGALVSLMVLVVTLLLVLK